MLYPIEEKTKIDEILAAFQPYIASNPNFDVASSPKFGYFFCVCYNTPSKGIDADFIEDADTLIASIIDEMYYDVLFEKSKDFDNSKVNAAKLEVVHRVSEYALQLSNYGSQIDHLVDESCRRKLDKER